MHRMSPSKLVEYRSTGFTFVDSKPKAVVTLDLTSKKIDEDSERQFQFYN